MSQTHETPDRGSTYHTPRWVKLFGIIALILVLLIGIMLLTGGDHGPSRHLPSGDAAAGTPSLEQAAQVDAPVSQTPSVEHESESP